MSGTTTREEATKLLRRTLTLDIVGDATATVGEPEDLITWTNVLVRPLILAWRCVDSGCRYVQAQAQARHAAPPVNGHVVIQLPCEGHRQFWAALVGEELSPGSEREFDRHALLSAWMTTAPQLRHLTHAPASA